MMTATNNAGAAMAVSGDGQLRPGFIPRSAARQQRRQAELLDAYLRGGGTINAFARIHRMTTAAVAALRATLPPMPPIAITGGKPKGSLTAGTRAKMDALAERIAEQLDPDVTSAGAALGWPQQSTSRIWGLIRRDLGPQAS